MATDEQKRALLARLAGMTPADVSVLSGAIDALGEQPEVRLTTRPGSANDALWTEMAALGWMRRDQPLDVPVPSSVFVLPVAAKAELENLLRDRVVEIFNELRRDLPPRIVEPVVAAGGSPSDVAMMLAGIIEMVMRRWVKDELHEEFLRAVTERARDLGRR